jgi:hypothetical protein
MQTLLIGNLVPHFAVRLLDGQPIRYGDLWQRRNLLLVAVADEATESAQRYLSGLSAIVPALEANETNLVVTSDRIAGLPAPSVVVADRWGEIVHLGASQPGREDELPQPKDLLEWIRFLRIQCPECPAS